MASLKVKGFLIAADAIVGCKVCGSMEGEPCRAMGKHEVDRLKPGYVHIARRISRLLMSAKATAGEREAFEARAVCELKKWLREHPLPKAAKKRKRRLTDQERMALVEIGEPGEGPVSDATFQECVRMGWGYWDWDLEAREWVWRVTAAGKKAKELDDLTRNESL